MSDDVETNDESRNTDFDRKVDEACDSFEEAWRQGVRPPLEIYLDAVPSPIRSLVFIELLSVELACRVQAGEVPTLDEYRERFPDRIRGVERAWVRSRSSYHSGTSEPTRVLGSGSSSRSRGVLPKVPGYLIEAQLGRGGMGVVYRAQQLQLDRPCALKMISVVGMTGGEAVTRFLAEARTVAKLSHPNIVQVYYFGLHDGQPYFEMEYVEGGSLAQLLDGTSWPADRAAGLVEAVATGVAAAHRLRIIHRDLKPANILLTADKVPKVADFGLAKSLEPGDEITIAGTILGTPSYMAPEQAYGTTGAVGTATDVYAIGAILYELLTGVPPFVGAGRFEVLENLKNHTPIPPGRIVPGLPRDLEAVCLKCLNKSPTERYESAGDLADDLRRFLRGEPTMTRPTEPPSVTPRRSRLVLLLATTGLVLVAASLAILTGRRSNLGPADPQSYGTPYIIKKGDTGFDIAQRELHDGTRWPEIKTATGQKLTEAVSRKLIPGQTVYLPNLPAH